MNQLKQIHAHTLRNGIDNTKFLIVKLLEIPNISYAQSLFDLIPKPTTFLYNKFIQAYSSHGPPQQCFCLYSQMLIHGCPPNPYSFTFLFAACASLSSPKHGQKLHTQFLKLGFEYDSHALTALIDMYAKCCLLSFARKVFDEMLDRDLPAWNSIITGYTRSGDLVGARELFESMPLRNVVSWTAIISGYSQNGMYTDALQMFLRMEEEKGVRPNEVTISSVLPACANLGALEIGERIEIFVRKKGFLRNLFVSNALLEMYAKCGRIDMAKRLFDETGSGRNLCTWNSMIMGLAVHGRDKEGLELFHEMVMGGTAPDDITFVGVLLACTHGGLVKQGWQLFESMEKYFSITPKLEHYSCMVDLLGRAGKLNEAHDLINRMPMKPDAVVWGALFGACSFYGHVELAEKAANSLLELEPRNPGIYVILSNVYASVGRWDGVAQARKLMKGMQITKAAGYSFIEVDGSINKFIVEDRSHPSSAEIYSVLDEVSTKMKLLGSPEELHIEIENCAC
ncbi:Pentatricopeptide repeat [Macleaya cordata]|uniref:Pentatricopeptide repeat n=1 Tax=Macleaya cordata TaxID=56857 RepID=A0A200PTH4_MACCD|nr:Pentatricopeptide repeat [Macleaya cordata]